MATGHVFPDLSWTGRTNLIKRVLRTE
jgi:hypothetical protein